MTSKAVAVVVGLGLGGPFVSPGVTLALPGGAAPLAAEESAVAPEQLEVEIVLSRYRGEERVASLPYTLLVSAGGRESTQLRMGVEAPIRTGQGSVQYRNVGTFIDCLASAVSGAPGNELRLSVEHSAVVPVAKAEAPFEGAPMFSTFKIQTVVRLEDGESTELVGSTDPVTGEVMRIEVSLKTH